MSTIDKMSIQGIRAFGPDDKDKQIVSFFNPLTLILGPNGTGKTTIIECLKYITTGEMPPGSSGAGTRGGNAFVHDPKIAHEREVKAQVKLQFFDVNNKMRSVTRSLQAVQKEKKVQVSTLDGVIMFRDAKGNKVQTTSKCIELNKEMISFLGVSKAVLENVIFCHQEEANWPLSEGKALKQKFDDIFASTRYVKALDCIRKTRQEQVNEMKTLKDVIKYAKQNKEKASEMKEDLKQAEAKFEASCSRVEEINTRLEPINEKLLILERQATDIYRLQTKIEKMKSERSQMEKNMEELRDSLTEEFTGSTDQLKRVLSQHKSKLHEQQNELSESEEMKQKLMADEQRADRQHQEQMLLHDRLLQEAKRHRKNLQSRDERVAETAEKYGIEGYSGTLEEGMIQDFLHLLEKKAEGLLKEAKEKRAHYEEQEDAVQAKMDEARDSKTKLESGLKMKDEMMVKNKEEIKDINRQLSRVEASAGRLEDIKRDLKETESELSEQEGALDVDSYKADISSLSKERSKLDTHSREVEAEMKQLHLDSKARTELEMLKKDKSQKEDNIRRLRAKNEDSLCHLLGYMPTENIKRSVEEYTRTQDRAVDKLSKEIQQLNIKLSSLNTNRDHLREELRKKEKEVRDGQESIFSTCDSQNFDEGLQRLQKKKENLMDQKGALLASERMFTKYVNKLQREDPPCPLCNRCFDDQKEVQDLIYDLTQKLSMVPEKVATAEKDYAETETKYVSMIQLKPTREKISELEQHDIPRLKTSMKEAERTIEKLRSDISGKEEDLTVTQSDLETAKTLQPDMVMIDRDQYELRNFERRIVSQAAKITGGDSDRTIQQVTDEKEDIQGQLDSISRNLENKRQKLSDHTDRIQRLKTSVNELMGDKLQIEGDLQQQSTLKDRKNELNAQVTTFQREIMEAREQLKPLQARMYKLRAEREKISEEKDERFEQDRKKSSEVKELSKNISRIQEEVERYINDGKDEEIVETKKRMKRAKVKLQEVQDSLKQVQESIDKIKEDLATQQVKERDLQDNLTLRTKESEIERKDDQIVTEQEKLGGLDPSRLERDRMKLRDEQDKLQKEKHTADGRKTTLQEQIASKRRELRDPMYATAEKDYRDKLIALRTTEIASTDLEKYYKALDSAIMRYHRCKMEELNKIIRERWRNTYKGNDIDTIEIQSDEEEGSGASKQRRSYNYRVQMIKGDTAIDMRGRCSAGQKVLASLIIRLALAETFCINCGFLALDEPTTNLDRENIESLAVALVEIIKDRRSQRNFQLLVITHDEDFVELLGRSDYVDEFYKVRKNADGCSQVVKARVQDLFSGR